MTKQTIYQIYGHKLPPLKLTLMERTLITLPKPIKYDLTKFTGKAIKHIKRETS